MWECVNAFLRMRECVNALMCKCVSEYGNALKKCMNVPVICFV